MKGSARWSKVSRRSCSRQKFWSVNGGGGAVSLVFGAIFGDEWEAEALAWTEEQWLKPPSSLNYSISQNNSTRGRLESLFQFPFWENETQKPDLGPRGQIGPTT